MSEQWLPSEKTQIFWAKGTARRGKCWLLWVPLKIGIRSHGQTVRGLLGHALGTCYNPHNILSGQKCRSGNFSWLAPRYWDQGASGQCKGEGRFIDPENLHKFKNLNWPKGLHFTMYSLPLKVRFVARGEFEKLCRCRRSCRQIGQFPHNHQYYRRYTQLCQGLFSTRPCMHAGKKRGSISVQWSWWSKVKREKMKKSLLEKCQGWGFYRLLILGVSTARGSARFPLNCIVPHQPDVLTSI